MPKAHRPRRGSMGFWPRKRAKRIYPRIKTWPKVEEVIPLAFAGYKVGMTHMLTQDDKFIPATIIEVPPLKVCALRLYKLTTDGYKTLTEVWHPQTDTRITRKIVTLRIKEFEEKIKKIEEEHLNEASRIKLVVHTQPWLAGIGKKTPEVFEIPIGGEDKIEEQWNFAKNILGNDLKITDVFKPGEQIDVIAVTKGKGFQGVIKRFGVKRLSHKAEKIRMVGSKGPWGPARVFPTVPMPGQMGFHRRTEYNKWLLMISDNPNEINPKSGWPHYGIVKSTWIALKGSVPGPAKRLIVLRKAVRPNNNIPSEAPKITYISLEAKN